MTNGWKESAAAWIDSMGETGDFTRAFVLDPAIDKRLAGRSFKAALDVGCGEGRFCRKLKTVFDVASVIGIDPTHPLLETARRRDPDGDYRLAPAEELPFEDATFDLVVSYLTLIDIADAEAAISEMVRVLMPGGTLLIANLNSFATASGGKGWIEDENGERLHFSLDNYLDEHADWQEWRGIRILNYHRPMSRYLSLLLSHGLRLVHFDEPDSLGGPVERRRIYHRVPYAHLMEWEKASA